MLILSSYHDPFGLHLRMEHLDWEDIQGLTVWLMQTAYDDLYWEVLPLSLEESKQSYPDQFALILIAN